MKRRQKYVSKKLQEKLSYFLDIFRGAITLPELKFLTDMLLGIIISKSVICMNIAGALNQDLAEVSHKKAKKADFENVSH